MDADLLASGLVWLVAFVFSTSCHEAAHAFAAHRLGDSTAYHGGQVTLNPLPHIRREPFGMIIVPILSFALQGWMIGWASAPYDPRWAMRYPRRSALMAMAGPAANLILAVGAGLLIKLGLVLGYLGPPASEASSWITGLVVAQNGLPDGAAAMLSILFVLNVLLFAFNLLPVPPLDGSAILTFFLPEDLSRRYQEFLWTNPMLSMAGILIAWKVFPYVFLPILGLAMLLIGPVGGP